MVKDFTKRYRKQELTNPKMEPIMVILEKDIIEIQEVDIKDVPENSLMETVIVIPDKTNNLDKALKKNKKQNRQTDNNIEQKNNDNE